MFQKEGSLRMQDINTGGDLGAEVVTEGGFPSHAFCQKLIKNLGFTPHGNNLLLTTLLSTSPIILCYRPQDLTHS